MSSPSFRISVNSQLLATIGSSAVGQFSCTVRWWWPPAVDGHGFAGLQLSLGGYDLSAREILRWPGQALGIGDSVTIEIVEFCESSPAPERLQVGDGKAQREKSVRCAARELGWKIVESENRAPEADIAAASEERAARLNAGTSVTSARFETSQSKTPSFRLSVNSQHFAVIGHPDPTHVCCGVDWNLSIAGTTGSATLESGGYDRSRGELLDWPKRDLRTGDTVLIEIMDFRESMPGPERRLAETSEDLELKKRYVREAAGELGWEVVEGNG
jgi:hypothetical protein